MNFKVNDYTTINNFVLLDEFEDVMKFGSPQKYQRFTGELAGNKVTGLQSTVDYNIYKLERV